MPWSEIGVANPSQPLWSDLYDISLADAVDARMTASTNNLRIGRRNGLGGRSIPLWGQAPSDQWPLITGCLTPPPLMHKLAAIANVVRQDVFAETVGGGVERAAAVDLRELLDEVHQHRVGGEH